MKTVVFIGHSECYELPVKQLEKEIEKCIKQGVTTFFSGGQGDFDRLSAGTVYRLKEKYPYIKNILVIPYLSFRVFNDKIFDEIVYPEGFEKYYFKAAIIERNKYMVSHSDTAICYINHNWGGAIRTYKYARKCDLKIVNLAVYDYE